MMKHNRFFAMVLAALILMITIVADRPGVMAAYGDEEEGIYIESIEPGVSVILGDEEEGIYIE